MNLFFREAFVHLAVRLTFAFFARLTTSSHFSSSPSHVLKAFLFSKLIYPAGQGHLNTFWCGCALRILKEGQQPKFRRR